MTEYFNYHPDAIWDGVVDGLAGLGYVYDSTDESRREFIARAVTGLTSSPVSNRRYSLDALLAMLLSNLSGATVLPERLPRQTLMIRILAELAAGQGGGGGGGGYVGPLDLTTAVVAFGQRAMSSADRGQPAYTIREDDGDTTQVFSSDADTGAISLAAVSSFLAGANGFVTQWVNKGSSATDAVQVDTSKQPKWETVGGLPGVLFDGVDDFLLTTGNVTVANEWTVFALVVPGAIAASATNHRPICGQSSVDYQSNGPDWTVDPFISAADYRITLIAEDEQYNNGLDVDSANPPIVGFAETLHLVDCVISVASPDLYIDGVSIGVVDAGSHGTDVGTITSPFAIGASGQDIAGTGILGFGHTLELIVVQGIVETTLRQSIRENMATAWGITLP